MINSQYTSDSRITLNIKSTSSPADFQIKSSQEETVAELGEKILQELNKTGKGIRLISSGKLLQPQSLKLKNFSVVSDGSFVHAVISDHLPRSLPSLDLDDAATTSPINPSELRGLDRLTSQGMSVNEVAAIRSVFQPQIVAFSGSVSRLAGEDLQTYLSRVEDLWMTSQTSNSDYAMNLPSSLLLRDSANHNDLSSFESGSIFRAHSGVSEFDEPGVEGSWTDFALGFLMGSVLGFILIFCVWDRNVSYRQKVGIMCGVTAHLLLTVIQQRSAEGVTA